MDSKNTTTVSIIVPVFNVDKYVEKCVSSIINAAPKDSEIILINDGSTDTSPEILRKLKSNYPDLILIDQQNAGLSNTRNKGISIANGEYLSFIDSDDWIDKDFFNIMLHNAVENNLDIVECGFIRYFINDEQRSASINENSSNVMTGTNYFSNISNFQPTVFHRIFKKSFLQSHNLYFTPNIYFEDTPFTLKAYYLAERVAFINRDLYYYFNRPDSITNNGSKTFLLKKELDKCLVYNELNSFRKKHNIHNAFFQRKIVRILGLTFNLNLFINDKIYRSELRKAISSTELQLIIKSLLFRITKNLGKFRNNVLVQMNLK